MSTRLLHVLSTAGALAVLASAALSAQRSQTLPAISVAGQGSETFVLITGLVGSVAGFHRLESRLLDQHHRVVIIDPYLLSIDSADVTFAAMARRVDRVLDSLGVTGAQVVAHGHGAGVALRLAANAPRRVSDLYLLDCGALPDHRSAVFTSALRLVPVISRVPGGRSFIRARFIRTLAENSGPNAWLDAATKRAYTEPILNEIDRVIAMAIRLRHANEPDSLRAVVDRVHVPVTLLIGSVPHPAGPVPEELTALQPLGAHLRVEYIPGVGHFPHEEAPDDVARRLQAARAPILASAPGGAP
jgi:magnesium chelatase accessory protein